MYIIPYSANNLVRANLRTMLRRTQKSGEASPIGYQPFADDGAPAIPFDGVIHWNDLALRQ
jgi:hypothetical protein